MWNVYYNSRKVWQRRGESLMNWLFSSFWQKNFWELIDQPIRRLLIVSTNSDGISLANHGMFAELTPAKVYHYTVIYYTKYYIQCHNWFMPTWIFIVLSFWQSACVWLEQINLQSLLYIYIYYFLLNEPCYYNDFLLLTN